MNIASTDTSTKTGSDTSTDASAEGGGGATASDPAGLDPGRRRDPVRADRLHRSRDHRMLAGVADGLADYFDVDTTLVRVGFVALALLGGVAVPLYLAGWLLIPEEGSDRSVAEDWLGRDRAA